MPDVPLIVLCSMATDGFNAAVLVGEDEMLLRAEIEGKRRLYEALAGSVQRGEVRLVDAGHVTMHLRHPDAVIRAIGDLLAGSRRRPFARRARPGLPGRALETRRAATRTQMAERTARG
jgi:hypothetical protein